MRDVQLQVRNITQIAIIRSARNYTLTSLNLKLLGINAEGKK
jgi:hypothetical protein